MQVLFKGCLCPIIEETDEQVTIRTPTRRIIVTECYNDNGDIEHICLDILPVILTETETVRAEMELMREKLEGLASGKWVNQSK